MEEQQEQEEVQQGAAGQLTSFILPLAGTTGGHDIQVENLPKVSPQVERTRMDDRGGEVQQEQAGSRIDIGVALHKPKRTIRQPDRYGFEEMLSYALVIVNGDPYTYQEAIESQDRERWVQTMSEEMQSLHQNQTWRLVQLPQGKRPIGYK